LKAPEKRSFIPETLPSLMADPMITENDKIKSKYIAKYQTIKQNKDRIIPEEIY
jgi:hypothetical protein